MKNKNQPAPAGKPRKPVMFKVAAKSVKIERGGKPAAAPAPPAGN